MVSHLKWAVGFCLSLILNTSIAYAGNDQIVFRKESISLANKKIRAEIAETEAEHAQGLMFRTKLGPNEGMLFVFDDEDFRSFWMKNTLINLSIGYFDKNKKLVDIQEMKAMGPTKESQLPGYPSKFPAKYALEMQEGWFKKHNVKIGSKFIYKESNK